MQGHHQPQETLCDPWFQFIQKMFVSLEIMAILKDLRGIYYRYKTEIGVQINFYSHCPPLTPAVQQAWRRSAAGPLTILRFFF